ncbi:MAG: hypothetical protein E6J83_13630 [Deltaproteobacteria bacterium]|nr:MAG: hypothetical protein E6J83_13630 [Deltaproteobacteria bacterium]
MSARRGPRARGGHRRPRARLTAAGRRAAIALLLGAAVAGRAAAQLRLEAESQVADAVTLRLHATNTAAEVMHDIVPEVVYHHRTVVAERVAAIAPGAAHEWRATLPPPPGPGTFPATIRLRYAAGDGRARSGLLVHLIRTPGAPPPDVRATLATEPVSRLSHAAVMLENAAPERVAGRLVVALPLDLRTDPESLPAEIAASGRISLPVVVQNVGARPGDLRPVFALFEYDRDGTHHTVLAEATLPVVGRSGDRRPLVVGLAALAVALSILAIAWRSARARRPAR